MSQKIILRSMVVLAVLAMTSLALAQEPHHMMKMKCGGPCIPNLTEEQQNKIDQLRLDLDKAIMPLQADLGVKKAELDKLLVADKPDRKAIHKKIDEIMALKTQIKKEKVDNQLQVSALLTPDQRVAFNKCHSKHGMKFEKMGGPCMGKGMEKTIKIKKMMKKPCPMESQKEMDVEKEMESGE